MKKTLARLYWIGVSVTMLVALLTMALITALRIGDLRKNLGDLLQTTIAWTMESTESLQHQAENIAKASPPTRVTFLLENGLVLADSDEDALGMELHGDRPEIREAIQRGNGDSLRLSETRNGFALYAARRVGDSGLIIRLSYPLDEIRNLIVTYGIALVLLFAVLFLLQRVVLGRFCTALVRQMDEVQNLLEGGMDSQPKAVFPELQGAINNIAYRAGRLNADLSEVNRTLQLRSDFVANASHEIRSPLTSIMGFAEMMDEGMADTEEERQTCISAIRSECRRMLDVVEDILLLSRAEGRRSLETETVDVKAVAEEIVQSLTPHAAQKGIALHLAGEMTLNGVEKSVWEILYNLADNAIRYGREGGNVWITLAQKRITVADDGVGIELHHLPHIFEQFYRVDETRDSTVRGTGLGLSIVRALAESLGGCIRAESEIGRGSTFIIDFEEGDAA